MIIMSSTLITAINEVRHVTPEELTSDNIVNVDNVKRPLKSLKKGEWFTLKPYTHPTENQVYIRGDYDRETKKYCCGKFSDISYSRLLKGDTPVYTDFIF